MQSYVVGGWVRDYLLSKTDPGIKPHDKDWVVVGATVEEMVRDGFLPVGNDFPVFLHPKTHEEYALARTERKSGHGYNGFTVYASPEVTLEEDLSRRDLTINAMAMDQSGLIIDPYGGQKDLKNKVLRHVSEAFIEDPLRLLRVARFQARFPDFKIDENTFELLCRLVSSGETDSLVKERTGTEFRKALKEREPSKFFDVLEKCGFLPKYLSGWNISDRVKKVLDKSCTSEADLRRFALSFLDTNSPEEVKKICAALKMPREFQSLAMSVSQSPQMKACRDEKEVLALLKRQNALRQPDSFRYFLDLLEGAGIDLPYEIWRSALDVALSVRTDDLAQAGLGGSEIGKQIVLRQQQAVAKVLDKFTNQHDHYG